MGPPGPPSVTLAPRIPIVAETPDAEKFNRKPGKIETRF
jgi:hypothetical protein